MLKFLTKKTVQSYFFEGVKAFPARSFTNQTINPLWKQLSEKDRINYALAVGEPENAEVAFYRGLGFKALGTEHAGAAIAAFRMSARMDSKYGPASKMEIALIYAAAGQLAEADKNMNSACQELVLKEKAGAGSKAIIDTRDAIASHISQEETQEQAIIAL